MTENTSLTSGWHLTEYGGQCGDSTDEYLWICSEARGGHALPLPSDAKEYEYLFIPGLLTKHYGQAYMRSNLERCAALGLNARKLDVDTDASVETNAEMIKRQILMCSKKVVIIGHSKGGVDAAAAICLFPELYDRVRALVCIQAPYGGTYVANMIVYSKGLMAIAEKVIEGLFKGDTQCMRDLTYEKRRDFLENHRLDATRLATISYVTTTDSGPMGVLAKLLKSKYGVSSDGMVPEFDAILPGSTVVRCAGVDHGGTVMLLGPKDSHQPPDITQALIHLALKHATEREAALSRPPSQVQDGKDRDDGDDDDDDDEHSKGHAKKDRKDKKEKKDKKEDKGGKEKKDKKDKKDKKK